MLNDEEFDAALAEVVQRTGQSGSQIVRDLVLAERSRLCNDVPFGAMAMPRPASNPSMETIVRDLKDLDDS